MSPSDRQAVDFLKCAFILAQSKLSIPSVVTNMSLEWPWTKAGLDWSKTSWWLNPTCSEHVDVSIEWQFWVHKRSNEQCCFKYVARLPLLCQGCECLNGKSVLLVFRWSSVRIPAGFQIYFSLSQQKHHHSWVPTVAYKTLNFTTSPGYGYLR